MTATEVLRNHGINVPFAAPGRIYATCPKCSHTRQQSHQKKKCLGITIDDESVHWGCNHCDWTGGERFDKSNGHDRGIVTYNYCDESGVVLFQKVRTPDKKFWQRRPDGNGGWINSLGETRKVLYRLPELIEDVANDHMVLIVEGEKDVDNLRAIGVPATCNPDGAANPGQRSKWRPEFSEMLRDARIVIVPDHDEAGYAHADAIACSTTGIAQSVHVLKLVDHWPQCPKGGDASDWLAAGHTREELDALIEAAPGWSADDNATTENDEPRPEPQRDVNNKAAGNRGLVSSRAADIPAELVQWLWPGRLAIGKHTCVAGEPGTGKSQISVAIAATLTTGGEWPCGEGRAPLGSVIILSAEDGAADTIVPRLIAAGADLTRVHIVSSVSEIDGKGRRAFNLQTDITLLERKISEIGDVVLVIVDPVSSYMGKTDSHKNSEVRGVLEPLSDMADRTRTAILTITHFSKAGAASSTKALHRFIGSIAFTGAPRAAFAVIDDAENEGRKLFLHAKNNLAAPPQGLAFRLEQTIVADNIVASRVAWDGEPVIITANQALAAEAAGDDSRTARGDAEEFLRELLASGPVPQKEVKDAAEGAGLAWATVRRAKERLGVEAIRETETEFGKGTGRWLWRLRCSSLP
jgi:putative DNA primase/helicase